MITIPIKQLIGAVLFDVDGVVVESELLHLLTFNELLQPFDIHISESEWKTRFLGAGSATVMTTLFKEHSITQDPAPWVDKRRELYRQHVAQGDLQPVPGFLDFYQSIQKAHLPVAFVSTGHPLSLSAALEHLGLEGKHPVIDVTKVKRLKPDPEAYLLGAQTLQVPPRQCLVFEDSPIGIAAAKSADMLCVGLTTTNPEKDLKNADLVIQDFQNWTIQTILDTIGGQIGN
ncbi:MAG: HAD family hydrolase [Candidatus Hodarchaeota archaeon]